MASCPRQLTNAMGVALELRVLEYFLALAREGTVSDAAATLHISQPTLSRQLIELEKELGVILFERSRHGITPTEEGVYLRRRAGEIVSLARATQSDLLMLRGPISGEISIGCAETKAMVQVAEIMREMQVEHPDVTFNIVSQTAEIVAEQIDRGLLDFGLLLRRVESEGLSYLQINCQERVGVVVAADSKLAEKPVLTFADLAGEPLLVPNTAPQSGILNGHVGVHQGGDLNVVATYNLVYNAFRMAEAGMGSVITLEGVSDTNSAHGFVFRPLDHEFNMPVYLAWKPLGFRTRACEVFWQRAQTQLGETSDLNDSGVV